MEKKNLGTFLAALRREKGWTQKELAELLHVSDKTVSRWERDESVPDLFLVPDIAQLYGITSDELIRGERSKSKEGGYDGGTEKLSDDPTYRNKLWMRYVFGFLIDSGRMGVILLSLLSFESLDVRDHSIQYPLHGIGMLVSAYVIVHQLSYMRKLMEEWLRIVHTDISWRKFCRKIVFRAEGLIAAGVCVVGGVVGQNIAGVMGNAMSGMNGAGQPMGQPGVMPPPIPVVAYHVAVNGQATGPYNLQILQQMIAAGQLVAETLVWKSGMAQWVKAGETDDLKGLFAPPVPPIPPTE